MGWRSGSSGPWVRLAALVVGVAVAVLVARALLLEVQPLLQRHSPGCTFRRLTGWHCPGCGGTRAFFHLLHGELAASWRMNPLVLSGLGLGLLGLLRAGWVWLARSHRRMAAGFPIRAWMGWLTLALVIAFGVLRNLPWWPFCLLTPG